MSDPSKAPSWVALLPESIPDALVVIDRQGKIVYANKQNEDLFGYACEDLIGKGVETLVPGAVRERHVAHRDSYFAIPSTRPMGKASGLTALRKDGRQVPVDISLSPIRVGDAMFAVASIRDVTERIKTLEQAAQATALEGSNRQLRAFISHAPVAVAMFDRDMRYIVASRRWLSDFVRSERDVVGLSHYDLFPDIPERWRQVHRRALAGEIIAADSDRFDRADGTTQWVRWEVRPWYDVNGLGGIIIFAEDTTERQRATEEILRLNVALEERVRQRTSQLEASEKALEARLSELQEANHDIILLQDMSELLRAADVPNEGVRVLGQFLPQFFPNSKGAIYLVDASTGSLERKLAFGDSTSEAAFPMRECWAVRLGRSHRPESDRGERLCPHCAACDPRAWCLPFGAGGEVIGAFHLAPPIMDDKTFYMANSVAKTAGLAISGLKLKEALVNQALRDPLTGIYNRRYMEEVLERELHRASRRNRPLAVLMLDLDYFKRLNDSYGHAAGDKYLVEFANLLKRSLRREDVLTRYGGEEFLVIFPECSAADAYHRAESIRQQLKMIRVPFGSLTLEPLGVSGGIAEFPRHGDTSAMLLQAADKALYQAKESGRDRILVFGMPPEKAAPIGLHRVR